MRVDRSLFPLLGRLRIRSPRLSEGTGEGARRSNKLGAEVEFADHRAYYPGDDLRLVDWNAYARLETLLIRLFHEERNSRVILALDCSASMGAAEPEKLDYAGSLAAALVFLALIHRDRVSLRCVGGAPGEARFDGTDARSLGTLLELLGRTEASAVGDPRAALLGLAGKGRADRAFLLSDMLVEEDVQQGILRGLAASSRAGVLLHVLGQQDRRLPAEGEVELVDAETGQRMQLSGDPALAAALQEAEVLFRRRLEARCADLGLLYVFTPTTLPLPELLFRVLRRSGVIEGSGAS